MLCLPIYWSSSSRFVMAIEARFFLSKILLSWFCTSVPQILNLFTIMNLSFPFFNVFFRVTWQTRGVCSRLIRSMRFRYILKQKLDETIDSFIIVTFTLPIQEYLHWYLSHYQQLQYQCHKYYHGYTPQLLLLFYSAILYCLWFVFDCLLLL